MKFGAGAVIAKGSAVDDQGRVAKGTATDCVNGAVACQVSAANAVAIVGDFAACEVDAQPPERFEEAAVLVAARSDESAGIDPEITL